MNISNYSVSFSCERASPFIPAWVESLFQEDDSLWQRAEQYDPYAVKLAEAWASIAKAPLHLGTLSDQVCNLDRSVRNPAIWSPWTAHASTSIKNKLLDEWYRPYHANLVHAIDRQLVKGRQVLHLSIRSSAIDAPLPLLNLQYSTNHAEEKHVACAWQSVLRREQAAFCLRRNSPKYGHADSITTTLREHFDRQDFLSIGVHCSRDKDPMEQAQVLHAALKKVLQNLWR